MEFWKKLTPQASIFLVIILVIVFFLTGIFFYPKFSAQQPETPQETPLPDQPTNVTVYITGMINRPGVYTLKEGNRILDLLKKAGGPKNGWDPEGINLAKRLEDEEMITVPRKLRAAAPFLVQPAQEPPQKIHKKKAPEKGISINESAAPDWEKLPGIGPSLAEKIVVYRKSHGSFQGIDDVKNVPGLGTKKFERIKGYLKP